MSCGSPDFSVVCCYHAGPLREISGRSEVSDFVKYQYINNHRLKKKRKNESTSEVLTWGPAVRMSLYTSFHLSAHVGWRFPPLYIYIMVGRLMPSNEVSDDIQRRIGFSARPNIIQESFEGFEHQRHCC